MARPSGRYNILQTDTFHENTVVKHDLCNFLVTTTITGWDVYWAGHLFHVPNKGIALLTRLKTSDFAPAWTLTKNLFPHLFHNPTSTLKDPVWGLRVILAAALYDQVMEQSLIKPLSETLTLLGDWLLTTETQKFNLRTPRAQEQISLRMLSLVKKHVDNFILKLLELHVINNRGFTSSIEIGNKCNTIIISRTNMGYLVEQQEPDKSALRKTKPGPVKFTLVHEDAFRDFKPERSSINLLIMEFNSSLAI
ncbi:membrane-associated protein [Cuevavirus lloviuense]|uniref:Membrane-associated protein VP24 n=1 Tax=Cuevavirus lloviuense TaxID=3052148 RepID=G8EFI8_9MONO|nr:membrane-associated protein [Cuevavirus lloviuense]UJP71061.1 viral protein 24 [synthetic construct]AER23678.1 VP24 [Cuevavirus lloviuense]UJP71070.1 viral protein 24 [synthetic construct]UJP71079.1 viral protein 24 [synthetic construct]UJP71088.1 viral protein 24 [synthetic construct]